MHLCRSQPAFDHFHQFHSRNRIEEMHTDHLFRTVSHSGHFRYRKRRSIGCQYRFRFTNTVQQFEYLMLGSHIFSYRLDHQISIGTILIFHRIFNPGQYLIFNPGFQFTFFHHSGKIFIHSFVGFCQRSFRTAF